MLGELLGNVADEFKGQRLLPASPHRRAGSVAGRLSHGSIARLGRRGMAAERGTVGEFVAHQAGRIPDPGEELTIGGLGVEIEAVENDPIASLIVSPPREAEQ